MVPFRTLLLSTGLLILAANTSFAHSYGPAVRVTAAPGDDARSCTACHAGTLNSGAGSVKILLQSGTVYVPGVKQRVIVQVSDPDQLRWGFELTARLNSDLAKAPAGEFTPVDNFTQVICEDAGPKPCLSGVSFVQHTTAGTRNGTRSGASFAFDWTPPATNAGAVTFCASGNAANGTGSSAGDLIYTSSVQLNAVAAAAPTISAIVSSATSAVGNMAANSWVTVYGTNLSATTRLWNDSDFVNGGLPVTLDGVGIVLTANNAPRRGYVGYVSPNQVNFLIPSDAGSATVQVQVKNPAGISPQVPMTTAAGSHQLITLDGKFVYAAHADGTLIGKSGLLAAPSVTTPANAGEVITVYGTGMGATTPALISSQVPTTANSVATLPTATIGGNPAVISAARVTPGAPGVYQVTLQVPAGTLAGDQPIVITLGTTGSVPVLITIR